MFSLRSSAILVSVSLRFYSLKASKYLWLTPLVFIRLTGYALFVAILWYPYSKVAASITLNISLKRVASHKKAPCPYMVATLTFGIVLYYFNPLCDLAWTSELVFLKSIRVLLDQKTPTLIVILPISAISYNMIRFACDPVYRWSKQQLENFQLHEDKVRQSLHARVLGLFWRHNLKNCP